MAHYQVTRKVEDHCLEQQLSASVALFLYKNCQACYSQRLTLVFKMQAFEVTNKADPKTSKETG